MTCRSSRHCRSPCNASSFLPGTPGPMRGGAQKKGRFRTWVAKNAPQTDESNARQRPPPPMSATTARNNQIMQFRRMACASPWANGDAMRERFKPQPPAQRLGFSPPASARPCGATATSTASSQLTASGRLLWPAGAVGRLTRQRDPEARRAADNRGDEGRARG